MTIVKVQLPVFTSDPMRTPALVYGEGRANLVQQPIDAKARAAMRGEFKAFFEAEWDGQQWKLIKRVEHQPW